MGMNLRFLGTGAAEQYPKMCIRDRYVRAVREPLLDLAEALGDTVRAIDPELETRPGRVLCRPNRDIRYSRDKSVYRDYMFLKFRRPGEERASTLGLYFDRCV